MRTDAELVALAHASFHACFRKLAEHCPGGATRERDGIFAFVTGIPYSLFNGCIVTERVAAERVDEALEWVGSHGSPHRLWLTAELMDELAHVPPRHGLALAPDPYPGMVLHPVPEPPLPANGVEVVSGEDAVREAVHVAVATGMSEELARSIYSDSFGDDPEVQVFAGMLEGKPVGTSTSIQGGGASGIAAVGTLPEARRRGVGTTLSWAAVDAGRRRGFDTVVLQASPMGLPVYEAMGFRTIVTYADFVAPQDPG